MHEATMCAAFSAAASFAAAASAAAFSAAAFSAARSAAPERAHAASSSSKPGSESTSQRGRKLPRTCKRERGRFPLQLWRVHRMALSSVNRKAQGTPPAGGV